MISAWELPKFLAALVRIKSFACGLIVMVALARFTAPGMCPPGPDYLLFHVLARPTPHSAIIQAGWLSHTNGQFYTNGWGGIWTDEVGDLPIVEGGSYIPIATNVPFSQHCGGSWPDGFGNFCEDFIGMATNGVIVYNGGASNGPNRWYAITFCPPPPPVAYNQNVVVAYGTTTPINVTGGTTDGNPNPYVLSYEIVTSPSHGRLNGFGYTPDPGYAGPDSFTFRAIYSYIPSGFATVSITVLPPPDIVATSLSWNNSNGGADFQYEVRSNYIGKATTAKLFWSSSTNTTGIIAAIFTNNIPAGSFGPSGVVNVPAARFESHPSGATHVLLALDYGNLVPESDESNNTLALSLNLPVMVLVRGIYFPGNTDPASYWSAASSYFGGKFEVWICDTVSGTEHVEIGSTELHHFISEKIGQRSQSGLEPPKQISIVAHSYGGLITRSYLLHRRQGMWTDDPPVDKVIMLSTPNCGSHLADLGITLGLAFASGSEGDRSCLTPDWVTSVFNRYCNDLNPLVPYYLFGAEGGNSGIFRASYPLLYNWPKGTENPNDGAVTSLSACGTRRFGYSGQWFRLWGLERQVGGYTQISSSDDHSTIKSNPSILSRIQTILLGGAQSSSPNQLRPQPLDPAGNSGFASIAITNGTIQTNSFGGLTTPIDDCSQATFSLNFAVGQVDFTLITPSGGAIDPSTTNAAVHYSQATNELGVSSSYVIDNPAVGLWTANLQGGTNLTNGIAWSLLVTEDSNLAIVPNTEYFQFAGNVAVSAVLANGTQAVSGAVLSASIHRPDGTNNPLVLFDDGAHGDGPASDGVYANAYNLSTQGGIYTVRYSAIGTNAQGHAFARIEGGSFQIGPQTATLTGTYSDQGVDLGPPPGLEQIAVTVGVQTATSGVYSVSAILADNAGNELVTAATAPTALLAGPANLTLHFDTKPLRLSTIDGPYTLTNVVLWDDSSGLSLRADFATNTYLTAPYQWTNFSDQLPPQAINDLSALSVGTQSVTLRWTAPDNEGKAANNYSIRYRKGGLWPGVWDSAVVVTNPPLPSVPGTAHSLTVTGLNLGNTYYFGIKSTDQTGNESDLSNVLTVRLPSSITSATELINGQFQCSFAGEAGRSYVVQVSTNLTQWTSIRTNSIGPTSSSFIFTDSASASFRQRFYRCFQLQ
jgi:Fibronectin type III domain/Bacterial Ig domain